MTTKRKKFGVISYGKRSNVNLGHYTLKENRELNLFFARAVEGISDSIHKYTAFKTKNRNRYPILFEDHVDENNDKSEHFDDSSDEYAENSDVLLNDQRLYTIDPQSISANTQQSNYNNNHN